MSQRTRPVLALAVVMAVTLPAAAEAHWFGFAFDAIRGTMSPIRLKPKVTGSNVTGRLRCKKPSSGACVARVGTIEGTLSGTPGAERLTGTLTYGRSITCQLTCDVYEEFPNPGQRFPKPPGPRSFWSCIYQSCSGGSRIAIGTFTTQRF